MDNQKPSERIKEIAKEFWAQGIDPGFSSIPDIQDYINAILAYLDEQSEQKEGVK